MSADRNCLAPASTPVRLYRWNMFCEHGTQVQVRRASSEKAIKSCDNSSLEEIYAA